MSKRLVLVAGSRALVPPPPPHVPTPAELAVVAEARAVIDGYVGGMHPGAVVLSGGAPGPDTWAREAAMAARDAGIKLVEFRLDGGRYEGGLARVGEWGDRARHDPQRWPLHRNERMVAAAALARDKGWIVEVLALYAAPHLGTSRGTDYTARHAELAKLLVKRVTVPAEVQAQRQVMSSVFFDVESGGFSPTKNALLEIGAVHLTDGHRRLVSSFELKIRPAPGLTIDKRAAEINGFNWNDWLEAPEEQEALKRFLAWLPAGPLVFGNQNIAFDINFINAACARNGLTPPAWYAHGETIDTKVGIDRVLKKTGKLKSGSLGPAAEYYGIPDAGAHRALADAERARLVYLKLIGQEPVGPTLFDQRASAA